MFPVLLPEQFHFPSQAWGGGPGAKWPAERISVWNSWAPKRKPGRCRGHTEAEEAGGDDKDRARRYDSPVPLCMYVRAKNFLLRGLNPLKYSDFLIFIMSGFLILFFSAFFVLSLHFKHTCRNTQVGNTDVTVFPVCFERLPMWQRLCSSTHQHKCGLPPCQGKLFDYKTHRADSMPGTLPLYFATQNTFHSAQLFIKVRYKHPKPFSWIFTFFFSLTKPSFSTHFHQ